MNLQLAFLQARMGSTRLPGKALLKIRGKTILARAIERLRAAQSIDGVVVLTTRLEEDDLLVQEAVASGAEVYRGPVEDVLSRFQQASELFRPGVVIRATADNPLIDIGSVDRIIAQLLAEGLDWCIEEGLPVGAATEALTAPALAEVYRLAKEPPDREHVTLYIKEHAGEFRTQLLPAPPALRRPGLRLTVDTPKDFRYVSHLISQVEEDNYPAPLEKYLELVD